MSHFYPPPMRGPAWYPPAGFGAPAWYPYTAAYALYPPAAMAPAGWYAVADRPPAPDPAPAEWMALVEPALNSVIPAIHGLLEISGLLLRHLPAAFDMTGSGPEEPAPDDPLTMRTGLGHIGLFGPAEPDVIDIEAARSDAALPPEGNGRDGAGAADLSGDQTEQA